jgi:hypothetical protein
MEQFSRNGDCAPSCVGLRLAKYDLASRQFHRLFINTDGTLQNVDPIALFAAFASEVRSQAP